jgi:FemAB-related protein (PEP-CTERM system-associated)
MKKHNNWRRIILELTTLTVDDEHAWNEFIIDAPGATFYHQVGWKNVVKRSYGHSPIYLIAKEKNTIVGVLPLVLLKSLFFGKKLVSVPFGSYGSVVAECREVAKMLITEAKRIVTAKRCKYLELRAIKRNEFGLETVTTYWTLILKLASESEVVWKKLNKKVRNATRKAMKSGLQFHIGKRYLPDFYKLYLRNMHAFGTPAHSRKFFEQLLSEFPKSTEVALVTHEEQVIASMVLLFFKTTMISGWAASDSNYLYLNPNNLMYWECIKFACEHGYEWFDFGRSIESSGTYTFKKHWGAEPIQLYYQYYLNKIATVPDISQISPERQKFARRWQKLPFWLTTRLGPWIRRNMP